MSFCDWFCKGRLKALQSQLDVENGMVKACTAEIESKDYALTSLKDKYDAQSMILDNYREIEAEEEQQRKVIDFWNTKWPKASISYKAEGNWLMDVRNLCITKSYILSEELDFVNVSYDDRMLAILQWVSENITYTPDQQTHQTAEFWQHPEETYATRMGDCEDGALLIYAFARIAGIPSYRIKLCAGWVQNGKKQEGHAYIIYLANNDKWYVIDWCFYKLLSYDRFLKVEHKNCPEYKEIWWTVNDEYSWAQHDVILNAGLEIIPVKE